MSKARKQAKTRKNIALVFFAFAAINVLMKLLGLSTLDTSTAASVAQANGMVAGYYSVPIIFALIGYFFWSSAKNKELEASYEDGSYKDS